MRSSEEIFTDIAAVKERDSLSLWEAVIVYAEEVDADVEELVSALDKPAIAQIRHSIADSILLPPSMRQPKKTEEIDFG